MKSLFLFILMTLSINGKTQKQVELYDLIVKLSLAPAVKANMQPWNSSSTINDLVKWQNASPVAAGQMLYRNGKLKGTIAGKAFTCVDEIIDRKSECTWTLSLSGKKPGYTHFSISTTNFPIYDQKKAIEMMFPANQGSFSLVKHCMEGATFWSSLYKVNIPGKKPGLMIAQFESMSGTAAQYENSGVSNNFTVTYFFDPAEAKSWCN